MPKNIRTKTVAAGCAMAAMAACSSSSGPPPLVNTTWAYISGAGTSGVGLTIKSDNTYENSLLELTSSTSGDAQTETGTVSISGSTIRFTPSKWTCAEPTDPPYSATYQFNGNSLEVAFSSGIVVFQQDTSTATTFSLSLGCFAQDGTFTPTPLEPVGSCASAGGSCAGSAVCCEGLACVTTGGGSCAALCTSGAQCQSGCCLPLSNVSEGVCGPCADGGT